VSTPIVAVDFDGTIDLHYDGAQWRVQSKYPDDVARGTPCQ
jgi:hypothetical protein